jgi:omega-6 fatty acid desaturase (delta-12 desaturase)
MYRSPSVSYAITLALAFPAAGFVVRTFIVQHDCGHGSCLASRRWRTILGRLCAPFTLLPYGYFRHFHGTHHATSGNLDKRHVDIETLTVGEYLALSPAAQRRYRVVRHPVVLFGLAPLLYFVVMMRLPVFARPEWQRERRSMLLTNVSIALLVWLLVTLVGWRDFLLVQAPITIIASTVGMWMFYVQHQFEDTYWAPRGVGVHARRTRRLVVLCAAGCVGLVYRIHRLPSHPSFEPPRAIVPPGRVSPRNCAAGGRPTHHMAFGVFVRAVDAVG